MRKKCLLLSDESSERVSEFAVHSIICSLRFAYSRVKNALKRMRSRTRRTGDFMTDKFHREKNSLNI